MSQWIRDTTRLAVLLRDGLRCVYCDASVETVVLTLDHLAGRETHAPKTLITSCWHCNSSRQQETVAAFCRRKGLSYTGVIKRIRRQTRKPLAPYVEVANLLLSDGRSVPPWWAAQLIGAKDAAMRRRRGGDLEEQDPVPEPLRPEPCPWCPSLCPGCAGAASGSEAVA